MLPVTSARILEKQHHPIQTTEEITFSLRRWKNSLRKLHSQWFCFQNPQVSRRGHCQEASFLVDTSHVTDPTCNSQSVPEQRRAELARPSLNHQICKPDPKTHWEVGVNMQHTPGSSSHIFNLCNSKFLIKNSILKKTPIVLCDSWLA